MDCETLRKRMVEGQLIARGIKNKNVIEAFYKIERHKFLPADLVKSAYADSPLAIGEGQTISQPYIVALMTEYLELTGREKVLEIGTGSGYQTAILAELSAEVYSIERIDCLAKNAEALLAGLGYQNIKIKIADGTLGWQEFAPFDRIIIAAASPQVPLKLAEQLKESGRLILPLGGPISQTLTLIEKQSGELKVTEICACVFVPLIGEYGYQRKV